MRCTFLLLFTLTLSACCACPRTTTAAQTPAGPVIRLVTSMGDIDLELDVAHAPISVANFLTYVESGRYDGVIFHRVIPGFVIQSGGHNPDLANRAILEGNGTDIDPKITNEWTNGLKNIRGSVGMARDTDPDSATRQFYINLADNTRLDTPREVSGGAGYAVFGRVKSGMEVVDAIAAAPTHAVPERDMADVPIEPIILQRAVRLR
ncbi:MAG: peptidylprolyl isomerase [Phycisphaeraceae bacterium]|nr:peptidylprolyl isomerase [Phycisphaeraceae bacterium]MCW5754507.1 peptidylprolyl isomerase [Phycisphaeraceae bacterium]